MPDLIDHVYGICADMGTRVQHILYNVEDLYQLHQWQDVGLVREDQGKSCLSRPLQR